jgi:hypothetical protein
VAALAAAALVTAWLLVDPHTPDLAAQVYRADLFGRAGFALWDARWYGGHHLPGYSLLFPPLGSLLGVRLVGALAALASVVLFERLASSAYGRAGRWAAALFALGAVGDLWIGRLSFALGVSLAMAAALALSRRRPALAAALACACAAASPVAGILLALAGATLALDRRSPRALLVLGAPVAAIVVPLALLFPEGGWEPFPIRSFAATAAVAIAFLLALPREERLLRTGGIVWLAACLACLLVHSPMGSNIARYGVLLAGPLLLASSLREAELTAGARSGRARTGRAAVPLGARTMLALCLITVWVVWGPVRETAAVVGSRATSASFYAPLERFLARAPGAPFRVEVPLTRSHWEAALLAPSVPLARGWEKQLDERYDRPLLRSGLSAPAYRAWLEREAVAYVALPDAQLDPSSAREGRLIRGGLPYLQEVFASTHWRVYRVLGATGLLSGPGRMLSVGVDSFELRAERPGNLLVRVHFSRYLTVTDGRGCVAQAPGGWTLVRARAAGPLTVAARFSLARALGVEGSCPRAGGRSPAA